ncbi:MAG: N-acetylneuraminic acid mutarotase [Arenicella sp.]|jgi:N-acetylneuraminic acid mutarotase
MRIALTILISAVSLSILSQDIWIQRDTINGSKRANAASFVLEDDGYLISGYDGFNKKKSSVSYDIDQDDWDGELSLGGLSGDGLNRSSALGFASGLYGYITGGEGTGFLFNDLWQYDRYNEVWTQMADFGGEARTQAVVFEIDDTAYVGLGKGADLSTFYDDFWKYNPTLNSWSEITAFPGTPRVDAVATDMTGRGYVGLGYDGSTYATDFYQYYPTTDSWTPIASFPGPARINAVSFAIFPQLFVTTGDDGFNYLNDTWEYNYFGDVWTQRADFPGDPRSGASTFIIESRPFVGSGFSSGVYYDDFYEYTLLLSEEELVIEDFKVFPNPTSDQVMIQLNDSPENFDIKLYSSNGQEIMISPNLAGNQIQIDLNEIAPGTYFIGIYEANKMLELKKVVRL